MNTNENIAEIEEEHSNFKDEYYERYLDARREAGIEPNKEEEKKCFMKYMVTERPIPTIDTDDVLPEVPEEDKTSSD